MKYILGTKQKMTQSFTEEGEVLPVTILNTGEMVITAIKNEKKDGYKALQFGYGMKNPKNINKAQKGHMKDLGNFAHLKEIRLTSDKGEFKVGDKISPSIFAPGDQIRVSAISKGKGFQGVVKRHGFKGGPRSHGQKHSEREPGSIGGGLRNKVPKNMRMAGRMGGDRITVKNLKVIKFDPSKKELYVGGAVPGRRGTLVEIRQV